MSPVTGMHEQRRRRWTHARDERLHVAIIMDGNGRWAKPRGLPRNSGPSRGRRRAAAARWEARQDWASNA